MKYVYIHNNNSTGDGVCIHEYDETSEIGKDIKYYIERNTCVTFILDLSDTVSLKTIQRLIEVLKKITENDNVIIDMTLRCDKLLREYEEIYDQIKHLL